MWWLDGAASVVVTPDRDCDIHTGFGQRLVSADLIVRVARDHILDDDRRRFAAPGDQGRGLRRCGADRVVHLHRLRRKIEQP